MPYLIQFDLSACLLLSLSSSAVSAVWAVPISPSEDSKEHTNLLDYSSSILWAGAALITFLFMFIIRISNEIYILKRKPSKANTFSHYSWPSLSLIYITCIFKNPKNEWEVDHRAGSPAFWAPEEAAVPNGRGFLIHEEEQIGMEEAAWRTLPGYRKVGVISFRKI